jgi:hypothetical protein
MSVFFGIAYLRCGATSSCAVKVSKLLQKNNKRFCPPFYSTPLIRLAAHHSPAGPSASMWAREWRRKCLCICGGAGDPRAKATPPRLT